MKFGHFSQYLPQKLTEIVHLEVVLWIILKSFVLFSGKTFNVCIGNNRRFYAINKNKVSIIICHSLCYTYFQLLKNKYLLFTKDILTLICLIIKFEVYLNLIYVLIPADLFPKFLDHHKSIKLIRIYVIINDLKTFFLNLKPSPAKYLYSSITMRGRCNRTMRYITSRSFRLPDTRSKWLYFSFSYFIFFAHASVTHIEKIS